MSESKSNQPISYGQSVVEPDFNSRGYYDDDTLWEPCVFGTCDGSGWLPADDYSVPCVCNIDVRGLVA